MIDSSSWLSNRNRQKRRLATMRILRDFEALAGTSRMFENSFRPEPLRKPPSLQTFPRRHPILQNIRRYTAAHAPKRVTSPLKCI